MKKAVIYILLIVILIVLAFFVFKKNDSYSFLVQATYYCDNNKKIDADFYQGQTVSVKQGEMPIPSGMVKIVLSDGRNFDLPQTISADGARYANNDESFVFWDKGDESFVLENNEQTYVNCKQRVWTLGNEQLNESVHEFLLSRPELSWKTQEGSSNVCVFQNLAPEKDLFPVYLWVRCGEYKIEQEEVKELSGTSVPVRIDYPNELSYYDLSKFSISMPRDGSLYDQDIKAIFPEDIWDRLHFDSQPLNEKIKQKIFEYFSNQ